MMIALPNRDRGAAAVGLYESRDMIGNDVSYHGMMAAWDHDHGHVVDAFGSHYDFGCCLSEVAPPLRRLYKAVRVWRGVQLQPGDHPAEAANGISWTRNRDVACWFALRYDVPEWRPFVFQVDLGPGGIVALHHARGEHEAIINLEELEGDWNSIVVDGSSVRLDDLEPDIRAPEHLVARWRRARLPLSSPNESKGGRVTSAAKRTQQESLTPGSARTVAAR
jgi:hypothetical protein